MNSVNEKVIKNKVGLLNLAAELSNISKACRMMGYSRDSFYRYKEARDSGGVEALFEKSKRGPNPKNRVEELVEKRIVELAIANPALGQVRVSNELRKEGISVSPGGVRGVWVRHGIETFPKRLVNLEKTVAVTGEVLTEAQIIALERKEQEKEKCGEIETEHPGYLGSQDTFYVGTLKGVGRIYQQTFVDTYSKVAQAKLYTMRTALTAADFLNDKVMPLFESVGIGLLRILTDRGSEYCGKADEHDYQLFLAVNDIDHSKTKARHPQTNGICERFHRTILNEFYKIAFRKKIYKTIEELQLDLDAWIDEYNKKRPHTGKMCCGRTPWETLIDGKKIWNEKVDSLNLIGQ